MNVLEDMAMQIGTDAYMRESESEKTCADCYQCHELQRTDGTVMMSVVQKPYKETVGAIKAVGSIVDGCGWCDIMGRVVRLDSEACDDWEES